MIKKNSRAKSIRFLQILFYIKNFGPVFFSIRGFSFSVWHMYQGATFKTKILEREIVYGIFMLTLFTR